MSSGDRIPLAEAMELAREISERLTPYVAGLKCVGSIRRQRPYVGDVEFLAIPHADEGLFGTSVPILDPVRAAMRGLGTWVQGADRQVVVRDVLGRKGFRLELNLVHAPSTWGVLLGIRTGPAKMSKHLVMECLRNGYRIRGGRATATKTGEQAPTDTEAEFFALAGIDLRPPRERESQVIGLLNDMNRYTQGVGT